MSDAAANPDTKTVHLLISGRVQGVGYRAWFEDEALELGLDGWVRNRSEGSVEALVHGDARKIDDLIRACHKGPPMARVDKVQVEAAQYDGIHGFRIQKTV